MKYEITDVPDVVEETGISADYWNEWATVPVFGDDRSPENNLAWLSRRPRITYRERYPNCRQLYPGHNLERADRLDELTREVNSYRILEVKDFDVDKVEFVLKEVYLLIYGTEEPNPWQQE